MDKYIKIDIPQYPQYELHYSDNEQKVYSKKKGDYLKNRLTHNGYFYVGLCNSEGVKLWRLNRLVWICMNGEIPENMQVNHINEIKTDNRIENLNLMTPKENCNWGSGIQRHADKLSMPIVGVHKTTLEVIEFPSTIEAERINKKFNQGNIVTCCQHKERKTVNNYYWFYKNEFNDLLNKFNGNIQDIIKYKISLY